MIQQRVVILLLALTETISGLKHPQVKPYSTLEKGSIPRAGKLLTISSQVSKGWAAKIILVTAKLGDFLWTRMTKGMSRVGAERLLLGAG